MSDPAQPQTQSASAQSGGRPSRLIWFGFGLAAGVIATICVGGAVAAVVLYAAPSHSQGSADHTQVARLAKILSAPLTSAGSADRTPTEAEVRAGLGALVDQAKAIASENSDLSPIAAEYADCLRSVQKMIDNPPSLGPLMEKGLETWRSSVNNEDREAVFGMLEVAAEIGKLREQADALRTVHTRILACRMRLAEATAKSARQESAGDTINVRFEESGVDAGAMRDRFVLTNTSGEMLTNAILVTQLTGESGADVVTNCYFAERWAPGEALQAVCASDPVWRETVHHAKRMRCRVIAAERTSRLGELTR